MSDLVGRSIGKYHVEAYIGGGGMADVYRALNPTTGNPVALKVMKPETSDMQEYAARFAREAKIATGLSHPYILNVFDYEVDDTLAYLTMTYVATGSLKDVMSAERLPLSRIAKLMEQIASALDYAHRKDVVHRDIKPDNVLIDESGNPLLSDFGLARLASQQSNLSVSGRVYGTPAYMAPEQILGGDVDGRCDVYALGVMLFEMLTGEHPFEAETSLQVMYKHANEAIPALSDRLPGLSDSLQDVIDGALAKKPADRYATAGELAQAFADALRGVDAAQTPPPLMPTDKDPAAGTKTVMALDTLPAETSAREADANVTMPVADITHTAWSSPGTNRVLWYGAIAIALVAVAGLTIFYIVGRSPSLDAQTEAVQIAIDNANEDAVTREILALGEQCAPEVADLAGALNDAGVVALQNNDFTRARLSLQAATTLDDGLARNCDAAVARSGVQRSFAWMNYAYVVESDTSLSPTARREEAENAYRQALRRDTENTQAAYLLALLLIEDDPTEDDLNEIIEVSRNGWLYLDGQSLCTGQHDLTNTDVLDGVRSCFLLKTMEAHARYLNGDDTETIAPIIEDAVSLAEANNQFTEAAIPVYTAEAYYVQALTDDTTTASQAICTTLNNVIRYRNSDDPDHTAWAGYASERLIELSCP